ncbi:MAG: GNAT family N-acetyltransferase [Bacteroidales bacterium]|nr:GNAT family N-acetyltransferase [Bacteroidales bacterium]
MIMNTDPYAFTFKLAQSEEEYEEGKRLFVEYSKSIDINLEYQGFANELEIVHKQYTKPEGALILIQHPDSNHAIGCVGIRKFDDGVAELKRMYIQPQFRGKGLASKLLSMAIDLCNELNYCKILLDTLDTMKPAIALYKKHGFTDIDAYCFNPRNDARFFELKLI